MAENYHNNGYFCLLRRHASQQEISDLVMEESEVFNI